MASEFRTVIDSGVAVSAVLLPQSVPRQMFDAAAAQGRLLLSEQQRLEFLAALVRDAQLTAVTESILACRDPKDNKFLKLAGGGGASHFISGDADLLALHPFRGSAVVTPQQFLVGM